MNNKKIVSCGGVVIFRNKVLVLYKNQNGRHIGWVMPKGSVEIGETYKEAALREVKEESGVSARVIKYLGKTEYTFKASEEEIISKAVHWYLMTTNSFKCKPQAEEFFVDVGFYKQHEAYHLLKFHDERQIMRRAFEEKERRSAK
ncbi:MAG: NUDIX domain-containing protein [Defluviitaleaceae bacterium]|nr:NUDIX domain-containing protein [Defluviitaleaceae bacterium]